MRPRTFPAPKSPPIGRRPPERRLAALLAGVAASFSGCATTAAPPPEPLVIEAAPLPAEVPRRCASLPAPVEACGEAQTAAVTLAQECARLEDDVAFGRALAAKGLRRVKLLRVAVSGDQGPVGHVMDRADGVWLVASDEVPAQNDAGRILLVERLGRAAVTAEYPLCGCEHVPGVWKPREVFRHRIPSRPSYGGIVSVEYAASRVVVKWRPQGPCPKRP